jgi:putative nucleotidyltransferase with HDIG domain
MLTQRPAPTAPFTRRDAGRFLAAAGLLVIVLTGIFAFDIVPRGLGLQVGEVALADVVAPRTVTYQSALSTVADQAAARLAIQPKYDYTQDQAAGIADRQAAAYGRAVAPVDAAFDASVSDAARAALLKAVLPSLTDSGRKTLEGLTPTAWKALRDEAANVLDQVERAELRDSDVSTVASGIASRILGDLPTDQKKLAAELIGPLIVPNSAFSESLTEQARVAAVQAVRPHMITIQQGENVIDKGHPITPAQMERVEALNLGAPTLDVARLGGYVLLAMLLVSLLLAWIWRFRSEIWHRANVLLLVGLTLVFMTAALKLTGGGSVAPFIVPTAAAGMLVAILLDAGVAFVLIAVLAVIAGTVHGGSLELATYVLLGGFAGIVAVRRGDRLNVFVQAGIATAVVGALVISVFSLFGARDLTGFLQLSGAALLAAAGSAVAAVGLFSVLGNLFGILTVFQLLELANPSQAILRRLLVETPGTYHHSIMVGNLAERAAEAIGADPLLTRVAAYYHDIGKLSNPVAFIENQAGGDNIHDELEPEVSAQILKQHVADGIDLAYRERLPKQVIAFIPQHHGTAIMSYFFARAREFAAAEHGGLATPDGAAAAAAVDERRFRHAGPKPQSREAALIMLADGVEASVRSLSSRDEPAIRAMVARIIDERLTDGQFDECDLTLRDVERIREAFVGQLLGMYHQRIAYPQNKIVEIESRRAAGGGPGA